MVVTIFSHICCFSLRLLIARISVNHSNFTDVLFAEGVIVLSVHWGLSPYPALIVLFSLSLSIQFC